MSNDRGMPRGGGGEWVVEASISLVHNTWYVVLYLVIIIIIIVNRTMHML